MNKAKRKLPRAIVNRIDKAQMAVTMSREKLPGPQPLIDLLETATTATEEAQARALVLRTESMAATATLKACADELCNAYGNLAAHVETMADGDQRFILGAGFETWAKRALLPPFQDLLSIVEYRMDKLPGSVFLAWEAIHGARLYQVQSTTDLIGRSGWHDCDRNFTATRGSVTGLTSGTRYAFRVRACGRGAPGPWSAPVQQMAP